MEHRRPERLTVLPEVRHQDVTSGHGENSVNSALQQRPPLQRLADGGNQRPHETSASLFNMWSTNVFIGGEEGAHRDRGT